MKRRFENMESIPNGYIDVRDYIDEICSYHFFVGGRATGKTFSAYKLCIRRWLDEQEKFIIMRRTAQELDIISDSRLMGEGANPFKPLNEMYGWNYGIQMITKNLYGVYDRKIDEENGKLKAVGEPVGYAVALSTVSSIRGVDLSHCSMLVYDEFIPERHVRALKEEGMAFLQAMETLGRNRELHGKEPMLTLLLANAFNIYNPVFQEVGIVNEVEKMVNRKQVDMYIPSRCMAMHILPDKKEFVNKKKNTALYKMAGKGRFSDINLNNDFAFNDFALIGYRNVRGYRPVCAFEKYYIWEKKGDTEYYITYTQARVPVYDVSHIQEKRLFNLEYNSVLLNAFIAGKVYFETYEIKEKFLDLLKIK